MGFFKETSGDYHSSFYLGIKTEYETGNIWDEVCGECILAPVHEITANLRARGFFQKFPMFPLLGQALPSAGRISNSCRSREKWLAYLWKI